MNMQLTTSDLGDLTAAIAGAFDAKSCAEHKHQFEHICHSAASKLVIVNMQQVDFLDASGIGALVFMFKRIKSAGGRLIIVGAQQQPKELLTMLRVNHIITMMDTISRQTQHVDTVPSIAA